MRSKAPPIGPVNRGGAIRFWIGMAVLALLVGGAAWASTKRLHWEQTATGLKYRVVTAGEGPNAGATDVASITYTGRLADGTVFDSNEGGPPTEMPVAGFVPGFSEALQLMNKGATYELRIPPELGYGPQGGGPIPPNATLDFTVTLVDRRAISAEERQQMQAMQQMQRQQMEEQLRQMQQGGGAGAPGAGPPEAGPPSGR